MALLQKKTACLGHTGFAVACHWDTTEPEEFWGSGAEQHFLGSVPTGIKGLVGRVS